MHFKFCETRKKWLNVNKRRDMRYRSALDDLIETVIKSHHITNVSYITWESINLLETRHFIKCLHMMKS